MGQAHNLHAAEVVPVLQVDPGSAQELPGKGGQGASSIVFFFIQKIIESADEKYVYSTSMWGSLQF